jgi:predicted phage terminase large subunit-like protein
VRIDKISAAQILTAEREACKRSLAFFVRRAWQVIEPETEYLHGPHIDAICLHLQAVTEGKINRLWIAIPPGMMKSLLVGCFWPAWEWGPRDRAHYRYLGCSHSASLATRDNLRMRRLVQSKWYQTLWGKQVTLTGDQNAKTKYETSKTGFREAMAFTSLTGNRGDRLLLDDVLSVDDALSDAKRNAVKTTFLESVPTRLNSKRSAIVVIQQRLHEDDIIGVCEANDLGYVGLRLPMEFEADEPCETPIGFKDWRKKEGQLLFPERFDRHTVMRDKKTLGEVATASQFQQRPIPRGGNMFQEEWFDIVERAPDHVRWVRGWDLAATDAKKKTKAAGGPAYTAGVKIGMDYSGVIYIGHVVRGQWSPGKVEEVLLATARFDGLNVEQDIPQDPGQAGKAQVRTLVKLLAGYSVHHGLESGSKELRAHALAAQAEIRNVKIVYGAWNDEFIKELCKFPTGRYKDQVDGASRGLARLTMPAINDMFTAPEVLADED